MNLKQVEVKKKKNKPRFTSDELETLVTMYSKNASILTAKHSKTVTNSKKIVIWKTIANSVNAVNPTFN